MFFLLEQVIYGMCFLKKALHDDIAGVLVSLLSTHFVINK